MNNSDYIVFVIVETWLANRSVKLKYYYLYYPMYYLIILIFKFSNLNLKCFIVFTIEWNWIIKFDYNNNYNTTKERKNKLTMFFDINSFNTKINLYFNTWYYFLVWAAGYTNYLRNNSTASKYWHRTMFLILP